MCNARINLGCIIHRICLEIIVPVRNTVIGTRKSKQHYCPAMYADIQNTSNPCLPAGVRKMHTISRGGNPCSIYVDAHKAMKKF